MKFLQCAALLTVALAKKLTLRSAGTGKAFSEVAAAQTCDRLQCPRAWRPKLNHHSLTGHTVADCCEKSCELFRCTGVYRSNEAYWGNVGDSPQVCCDKMCGSDFECDAGYVLADATAPGVSREECCKPKCSLFECTAPWAPSDAKKEVVSSSAEDCCDQTCAAVNCSAPGWTENKSKALLVGNTVEECCAPLCGNDAQVVCPAGTAVKPEDVNKTGGVEGCCQKQCKSHQCSAADGWTRDISKADDFADSDEACCAKTCKQFECPVEDGWTASKSMANDIGDNVTQCCKATCKRFTCNATEGWLPAPGNEKDGIEGDDSSTCCVAACSDYTCSPAKKLMLVPDAAKIPGAGDEVCCESSKCDKVRSMTKLGEEEYCNDFAEDICEKKFVKHQNSSEVNASNGTVMSIESTSIVLCYWDVTYTMCRNDVDGAIKGGCADV